MSRVGKYPITVPEEVVVTFEHEKIIVRGKLGVLSSFIAPCVTVTLEKNKVFVRPQNESKLSRAMWGTSRANIHNMIIGVKQGFSKRLELVGVGYRAIINGSDLALTIGFSHDIIHKIPKDVSIQCDSPTLITLSGVSKERVGQVAAEIRSYRPPEPYKGKGIKYIDELIVRKEGKKK